MILKSVINTNTYAWVRIPKTATRAYTQLLSGDNRHYHMPYNKIIEVNNNITIPCVTVVRDPYTRFVSIMRHFSLALNAQIMHPRHTNHPYSIPVRNTTEFCNFFYKYYDKNLIPFEKTIHNTICRHNIQMYMPFFKTQVNMIIGANNPLIFRYEHLEEFNTWLTTEIGVDSTQLQHIGKITTDFPFNIDLYSDEVKTLVKYLFEEDYIKFNYL